MFFNQTYKMSERRSGVCVKKSKINPEVVLVGRGCQVCGVYDAMYVCKMCKRNVCMHDIISTKHNGSYCKICINDVETSPYALAVIYNERRRTCYTEAKRKLLYIMSGDWIRRKKDEWARSP